MKRKFSIFALTILLLGQTLLGPLATVSAAEVDPNPPVTEEQSTDSEVENATVEDPVTEEKDSEEETSSTDNEETTESVGDNQNAAEDSQEQDSEGTEEEQNTSESNSEPAIDGDNDASLAEEQQPSIMSFSLMNAPGAPFGNDAEVIFNRLVVNGTTITNPNEAHGIEPKIGDSVEVHYNFVITPTQDYGVGSTYEFDLPPALLNFDASSLSGTLQDGDVKFSYATSGNATSGSTVTLTLVEGIVEDASPYSGTLRFTAKFSADGSDSGLDQTLKIPVAGGQTLEFEFTFKPNSSDRSMSKSGTARIANGERYIDWVVWTNREGANLQGAQLADSGDGHVLDGDITVEQYSVGLTGVEALQNTNTVTTGFPVTLDNGQFAYKLTYTTKVTREPEKETEVFTNNATLTNGSNTDTASASATHVYGTKLDKTAIDKNKYNAKWEIKYNYFGSKMASETLTDTITGPHKIKAGTVKIYNVAVDEAGNGTEGSEYNPSPAPNVAVDGKSFTVNLPSPNGEAYLIKYETELDSEYVTKGENISNEASYDNNKASDGFWAGENIFSKSGGTGASVDHNKKEITWTIRVTAEKAMNNFVIEDDFTSYTEGGTRQKLVNPSNPFTISGGVTPTNTTLKGTDGDAGFTLEFGNVTQSFTITYKTKYDILPNGTAYTEYENTAVGSWKGAVDGKDYSITKSARYAPGNSPTGNNGYKNGEFDHVNQVFNWKLAVNINKQDINGAKLVDVIGEGHELVPGTIKVHQLDLGVNDETGTPGDELTSGRIITEATDNKGFTIEFTAPTSEAYIVTYQTKDSDDIIGHENGNSYGNTATFTTPHSGSFTLPASTTVRHANDLIDKKAVTNAADETITWTVDVNKSHSALSPSGENIVLTDKMSANQLILPDTFKKREIKMNAAGTISYGDWESVTPTIDSTDNSFTLDLGNLNQKGYQIEYKTFFLGGDGDKFSNKASINYNGATTGVESESEITDEQFNFNDSSGTISSKKGNIELQKIGLNPINGEKEILAGITFHLLNKTGTIKIAEATTDSNGNLTFEDIRYGKYQLEEQGTPSGYTTLPAFEITMNDSINILEPAGKALVVNNIKDVDMTNACSDFTLTVKDADGDNRGAGVTVKFLDDNDDVIATGTTNSSGEVVIARTVLPAGSYKVVEEDSNGDITLATNFKVVYESGKCQGEVQSAPKCEDFTIKVNDKDQNPRPGVEVTLKDSNGDVVITTTTDSNAEFTVPSKDTPPGTYHLYEGKVYLGVVNISYTTDCQAVVQDVPKCDDFTITLRDVDGNLRPNVSITIKDENDDVVVSGTTDANGTFTTVRTLEPGEKYTVFEGGTNEELGSFFVDRTCEVVVQPKPVCTNFTITVKDESGNPRPNVTVTLKNKNGNIITTTSTNANGEFTVPSVSTPAGTYDVYENKLYLGEVEISYLNSCNAEITQAPVCPDFTLTVQNASGYGRSNVEITIQDASGGNVVTVTTGVDGKVNLSNTLKPGTYKVYEGSKLLGEFEVENTCEAIVKAKPTGGGGGGGGTPPSPTDPEEPNKPGEPEEPNKPGEPEDPDKPVEPENPDEPGEPEGPTTPGQPGDPSTPGGSSGEKPGSNDGNKGDGGSKDKGNQDNSNANKGAGGSKTKGDGQSNVGHAQGEKLPQTGEGYPIGLYATGLFAIAAGLWMVFRRKSVKQ